MSSDNTELVATHSSHQPLVYVVKTVLYIEYILD